MQISFMTNPIMLLFIKKLEWIQYNAPLAIIGAIQKLQQNVFITNWALKLRNSNIGIENVINL